MLATASVLVDIGRSLREGFFMFWETLWPLVLGFGLSGAVQTFVSKDAMQRALGDHRAPALARASVFGMASSSCSFCLSTKRVKVSSETGSSSKDLCETMTAS